MQEILYFFMSLIVHTHSKLEENINRGLSIFFEGLEKDVFEKIAENGVEVFFQDFHFFSIISINFVHDSPLCSINITGANTSLTFLFPLWHIFHWSTKFRTGIKQLVDTTYSSLSCDVEQFRELVSLHEPNR